MNKSSILSPNSHNISRLFKQKQKDLSLSNNDHQNQLDFCFRDYLQYVLSTIFRCFYKSSKRNLVSMALQAYGQEVDLMRILNKIHEIEKFKAIFLDRDQLNLFNSLAKPLLDFSELDTNNDIDYEKLDEFGVFRRMITENFEKKNENFMRSFKKIKKLSAENKINLRLLALVDENLLKFEKNE